MTPQQIAAIYDGMTPDQQNMPRNEFIRTVTDRLNPAKIVEEVNAMVRGRIQKTQIDAALREKR